VRVVLGVLGTLLVVLYPVAVYVGLTRWSARGVALVIAVTVLCALALRARGKRGEHLRAAAGPPLAVLLLAIAGAILDEPGFVLAMPVLVNVALLATFGASLRGMPMVERFARMTDPELGPAQVRYCRSVTIVWCVFFVVNGTIAGALALFAPLSWWASYTGLVAYVAMGALFAIEYVVRKARFREYGRGLHDRLLSNVFPPRSRP
jgi:uncharacterized membrane protein